ncbi:hypothetical protein, partial [Oceanisphaera litoralis]|uniref:hypothetical protein n=1 Tax=Oceanisphaera litoralis TaxID=225144 RepID=UPI00195BA3B9
STPKDSEKASRLMVGLPKGSIRSQVDQQVKLPDIGYKTFVILPWEPGPGSFALLRYFSGKLRQCEIRQCEKGDHKRSFSATAWCLAPRTGQDGLCFRAGAALSVRGSFVSARQGCYTRMINNTAEPGWSMMQFMVTFLEYYYSSVKIICFRPHSHRRST